jgi:catechol 2,3-dioxygenase-like lactoylglutathione lyase family enzyme
MTFLFAALLAGAFVAQEPPPQLRVSMISLGVTDMNRSIRFYTETLGLPVTSKSADVTLIRAGEITVALNVPLARSAASAIVGAVEIIFTVGSVAASYSLLATRGCNFIAQPHQITADMWAATFTDPDGHKLTILGPR